MVDIGNFGYVDQESMAGGSQVWFLLKLLAPKDVSELGISSLRVGGSECWYTDERRSGEKTALWVAGRHVNIGAQMGAAIDESRSPQFKVQ
jgi:hypothetical protein